MILLKAILKHDYVLEKKSNVCTYLHNYKCVHRERECLPGLGIWSVLVVQSEQHVIYRLMAGRGREAQAYMEETDRERLLYGETHNS